LKVAIATSFYESGRDFLADYAKAVAGAAQGRDLRIIAAVDDLRNPEATLRSALGPWPVTLVDRVDGAGIPEVRGRMLCASAVSDADMVVFIDMDDMIESGAISRHAQAIEEVDFSYGDLQPVDSKGRILGPTFFEGAKIPERVTSSDDILLRNFLGFSNTAIRPTAIDRAACDPPKHAIAVDWWVFATLADLGRKGARADGVVAKYRQHDGNTLGASASVAPEALRRRCEIVTSHLDSLTPNPRRRRAAERVARVSEALRLGKVGPASLKSVDARGAWFEEVARLVDLLEGPDHGE